MRKLLPLLLLLVAAVGVVVRGVQQAGLTSGGPTQDYAVSGAFGGANPKGLINLLGGGVTNGTLAATARMSVGLSDGTNHRCVGVRTRDAQSTSSTLRQRRTNRVGWNYSVNTTSSDGDCSFSAWGADKVTLNWDTLCGSAFLNHAILLGGSDFQCVVGDFLGTNAVDSEQTVSSVGFEFDALMTLSAGTVAFDDTGNTQHLINVGFVTYIGGTINQACLVFLVENNITAGAGKRSGVELDDNRGVRLLAIGNPITSVGSLEWTEVNSSGFKTTTRDSAGVIRCAYMAMKFNGALQGFGIHTRDSRTTNGTDDFSTPGYPIQAVIGAHSLLTALNTLSTGATGGSFGVGFQSASEEFSVANIHDVGLTTSDANSLTNSVACHLPQDDQSAGIKFNRDSIDTLGVNLAYTETLGSARKQLFFVVGRESVKGKAMCVSTGLPKAVAKVTAGGRARGAAQAPGRSTAKMTAGARAKAAAEAPGRAIATVTVGGGTTHLGRGTGLAESFGRAVATVAHAGRSRVAAQAPGLARAASSHAGRAKAAGQAAGRAVANKTAAGRSKATGSSAARGVVHKTAVGKARGVAEGASKGVAKSAHVGRSRGAAESPGRGRAKHTAFGRARASSQSAGKGASLAFTELVGFYQRTSKLVRQRLKAVAGGLAINFSNLPFAEPSGGLWARARVDFDEVEDVQYGSGRASYYVPGALEVDVRGPLLLGEKAIHDKADALADQLELTEVSGVVYSKAAAIPRSGDRRDDEYGCALRVPFRALDSFNREAGTTGADDDFQGAEKAVRARFKSELSDVVVTYDNLPPAMDEAWVRLHVESAPAYDAEGMRRTVGIMEAYVHVPAGGGEKIALSIADRIVVAFRLVAAGGVRFAVPYLRKARGSRTKSTWVQPVFCPWSCDHA